MAEGSNRPIGSLPVFIHQRSLPDEEDKPFTVYEICGSAERTSGFNTMLGAQKLGVLWRLYPKSEDARTKLLIDGLELRGHTIQCLDKNPFIVRTGNGDSEVKTTKLTIGNVPISFNNEDILQTIEKLGCKPQSKLYMERDRDERGRLTRWLTGRRFLYIEVPEQPLPQRVDIGSFKATLFHYEQKLLRRQQHGICGRCFSKGHESRSCPNDIVCRVCRQPGHKQGDFQCTPLSEEEIDKDDEGGEEMNTSIKDNASRDPSPSASEYFDTSPDRSHLVSYPTAR